MQEDNILSRIEEYFHVLPLGEKSLDFGKILSTGTSVEILEAVYNSDAKVGLSASEISKAIGVGRTTVIYHLGRMQESGLVKINPNLENEDNWNKFWNLYRSRNAEVSKEQFNKLHTSRMNGIKLFVPTKKGFLVLPSTDEKESMSMAKEALTSIITSAVDRDYRSIKRTTSILGTIGLLLITLSFMFQMPFFQYSEGATGPAVLSGKPTMAMKEFSAEGSLDVPPTTSPGETRLYEKSAPEALPSARLAEGTDLAIEKEQGLETEKPEEVGESVVQPEKKEMISPEAKPSKTTGKSISEVPIQQDTTNRIAGITKVLSYFGTLLLGSFLGFLLYSYLRRRHSPSA